MNIKRYTMVCLSPVKEVSFDQMENSDGEWVKYEDMEVVFSILKDRISELQLESDGLREELSKIKEIIQEGE